MSILWLHRFTYDDERGLRIEDVTREQGELEVNKYLGLILASYFSKQELEIQRADFMDSGDAVRMNLLINPKFVNRLADELEDLEGYGYQPLTEGSENFGYYSDTPAWLIVLNRASALMWRPGDEKAHSAIMRWLACHAEEIHTNGINIARLKWPDVPPKVVVPEIYERDDTQVCRRRRKRRRRMRV